MLQAAWALPLATDRAERSISPVLWWGAPVGFISLSHLSHRQKQRVREAQTHTQSHTAWAGPELGCGPDPPTCGVPAVGLPGLGIEQHVGEAATQCPRPREEIIL